MEVLDPRSALLCNYEVLVLLRELEADHLARTKAALRIKKEEESAGHPTAYAHEDTNENLRTIEIEAIQYLAADFQPTASQTPEGITQLVKGLAPYGLTKAEKLQVVNLAPTEPVELYVIVEELEDRFPDQMEPILAHVRASLGPRLSQAVEPTRVEPVHSAVFPAKDDREPLWEADESMLVDENVFDDAGQGVGVEGDLEGED